MLFYICLLLCVAIIPLAVISAILANEYEVLVCLSLPLIGIPGLLYIIIQISQENKNIRKWQKDCILLPAHIMEVDRIENSVTNVIKLKISVKFIYNGVNMIQQSGEKNKKKGNIFYIHPGYDAIFSKYSGHQVNILYSPAYDQVLLLEN